VLVEGGKKREKKGGADDRSSAGEEGKKVTRKKAKGGNWKGGFGGGVEYGRRNRSVLIGPSIGKKKHYRGRTRYGSDGSGGND